MQDVLLGPRIGHGGVGFVVDVVVDVVIGDGGGVGVILHTPKSLLSAHPCFVVAMHSMSDVALAISSMSSLLPTLVSALLSLALPNRRRLAVGRTGVTMAMAASSSLAMVMVSCDDIIATQTK